VRYVDAVTQDPTGEPLALQGSAFLQVVLQDATTDDTFQVAQGQSPRVYSGPSRVEADLPNVREVAVAGDFEAVLSVAIGLDHEAGFRVSQLTAPDRIVVDVAH
jgi:hypothetical protein